MNEMALVELFWNVHRRIARRLSPLARGKGLSASELVVLWKAHRLGQCRVTVLAEDLGVAPSTLTGMLDRLVKSNWLQRGRDPDDRRAVILKTTPALDELVRDLRHEGTKSLEKVFRRLPAEVRERLGRDLASVLSCLEQDEEKVSE